MRKLFKYLKDYKKECVLAPLFKMLEAVFELTVPLVIARMIDKGIRPDNRSVITGSFVILLCLATVGLAVSVTAQYFAAKAATGFSRGLRHDLFSHILSFGFSEIDHIGTSTLITRMTADVNTLQNGVNMFLRLFLRSPFIVTGAMVMAFTIDSKSALIFVGVILALSLVIFVVMKINIPLLVKGQEKLDAILRLVRQNLSGVRVIRAFVLEDAQVSDFEKNNSELTGISLVAGKVSGALNPLTYVLVNIAIVMLVATGDERIRLGVLTTGAVVALYNYMSQILLELIKFANLIVTMNRSLASAKRVSRIFERKVSMTVSDDPADILEDAKVPAVEFKNVSLKYHESADDAISDITFSIRRGESFGIIGGTGSGKTSIANLIPRFYDATAGEVFVGGINVRDIDIAKLRKHVGTVMQTAVLFEGSIRDNLLWGNGEASDDDIMEAVDAAVCTDVVKSKGGLDGMIEARGRNLSGGQRQRLCIARVLVGKPEILILDDASSALDYMTDKKLRENIANLSYHPTVIIIAQRTVSVEACDRILVVDDGNIEGIGTHTQLLESCDVYKEIYSSIYRKEEG
ncbi:MAG: ABC transporter ATP-binding protein [Lachnospiraceae bacterium]|nr:ABC transporter ATP-binding protein [Lachnospiraceae bacterium]